MWESRPWRLCRAHEPVAALVEDRPELVIGDVDPHGSEQTSKPSQIRRGAGPITNDEEGVEGLERQSERGLASDKVVHVDELVEALAPYEPGDCPSHRAASRAEVLHPKGRATSMYRLPLTMMLKSGRMRESARS